MLYIEQEWLTSTKADPYKVEPKVCALQDFLTEVDSLNISTLSKQLKQEKDAFLVVLGVQCTTPFCSLDLPQKSGHPYVAEVMISDGELSDSSEPPDEPSTYFTTVQHNNAVILVVEVKKSLPVEFSRNE